MEHLIKQVRRARWRLIGEQFASRLVWTALAAFLVAAVGIGIKKLVAIEYDGWVWSWSWLGGAAAVAVIAAAVWTYLSRRTEIDAAIEIDKRFELKERVSSALALGEADRQTEFGQALTADAIARINRIDVAERFRWSPSRRALLPIASAALAVGLLLVPDKIAPEQAAASSSQQAARKQIEQSSQQLRKKLDEKRRDAEKKQLKDAADLFTKIEEGVRETVKAEATDRKQAVVKLNNLADEIKERRQKLADLARMKPDLAELKKVKDGPAAKLADALKNADLPQAMKEIEQLKEQLRSDKLDPKQAEKLVEQLRQMQDKLNQARANQEKAKEQVEKQLSEARKAGDQARADELQRKLESLERQLGDREQLKKMAEKLGDCAKALSEGKKGEADAALRSMADDLRQMSQQLEEGQMLEEALDQIAQAKNSMACKECEGEGCSACQGGGKGQSKLAGKGKGDNREGEPGDGLGRGKGFGERPENKNDTKFYDSTVKGNVGKGKSVTVGEADGPNIRGKVSQAIRTVEAPGETRQDDPQANRRLPPAEREQVKQYFDALRGAK
jgi:hypothetical protein